mmetsp:Transcript_9539/g.16876  ORF Transcript_9539/g.16876 Transcript_9539/m.16876 type:complete len:302 (+) Transcript_9539:28-933(+)|eukprot:CAMPEP_0119116626 /NCGR_PEP_ID=MMETSP1180-20130426/52391_1 /TAXON_ID=3052 ORGANISM="Chlamydomonas cf sp, Strain CCMP681" /NCGR_SAMPLE_ID=MMETSP1180 /ASSEMBLY_ACC=CAM_ASM_000741 /LENGTH=301 /DNA_ID=CAMNT_0007105799 /DNA_START=26 /DNA_END=931 /DNA_ORIENTATION=-
MLMASQRMGGALLRPAQCRAWIRAPARGLAAHQAGPRQRTSARMLASYPDGGAEGAGQVTIQSAEYEAKYANQVWFTGNTGKDWTVRKTKYGTIATTTLAISMYKGYDKPRETDWYNIEVFGEELANQVAKRVPKGTKTHVQGSLYMEEYEYNGVKKMSPIVRATAVYRLSPEGEAQFFKRNEGGASSQAPAASLPPPTPPPRAAPTQPAVPFQSRLAAAAPTPAYGGPVSAGPADVGSMSFEEKWQLVRDQPNLFWDNRSTKTGKQPDFSYKNKAINCALWIDSKTTPPWAREQFTLPPQ